MHRFGSSSWASLDAGKTTVGRSLAAALGLPFIDADDLHPPANVVKMAAGVPLADDDRWPWLDVVGSEVSAKTEGIVVACSALKKSYRDVLRSHAPEVWFAHLAPSPAVLGARLEARSDHFMPPTLLESQLDSLEALGADEAGITIAATGSIDEIVSGVAARLPPSVPRSIE